MQFVYEGLAESRPTKKRLTLILLTWKIWWAPNNASKCQMGFNSAFKGLTDLLSVVTETWLGIRTKALEVKNRSQSYHDQPGIQKGPFWPQGLSWNLFKIIKKKKARQSLVGELVYETHELCRNGENQVTSSGCVLVPLALWGGPNMWQVGWREWNQQDATNLMFIIILLSQHVCGIITPIIRRTRVCTASCVHCESYCSTTAVLVYFGLLC